ncbi:DUF2787 family protein [Vibrio sp. VB16]|uniref:DUF2787 family protein n=1 Tax=Vibrio sp. VB16 TaxID=2785746 RepID=UPI00189FBDBE|nr:DUF2787 family protein [Vibrio sp. VB16]UGA53715.1 DUF2787 domain-containing protein [Vibrio sp. VB16]
MTRKLKRHPRTTPSIELYRCLNQIVSKLDIPANAKRIAINFRRSEYYQTKKGFRPVEIQLERQSNDWTIVFVASFAYPDEHATQVDVELYFNFLRGWFFQPDIHNQCDLHQPKVTQLWNSWEVALLKQINNKAFNELSATLVSINNQPA